MDIRTVNYFLIVANQRNECLAGYHESGSIWPVVIKRTLTKVLRLKCAVFIRASFPQEL